MKLIKWIFLFLLRVIKVIWFSLTLVVIGVSLVWNIPTAIISLVVYGVQKILDWIDRELGLPPRKKFKVIDNDEPISKIDTQNSSEEVGDTIT